MITVMRYALYCTRCTLFEKIQDRYYGFKCKSTTCTTSYILLNDNEQKEHPVTNFSGTSRFVKNMRDQNGVHSRTKGIKSTVHGKKKFELVITFSIRIDSMKLYHYCDIFQ